MSRSARLPIHALALLVLATACGGGGIEGRYYNSRTGEFAIELKDGKVVEAQGLPSGVLTYEVVGDSVFIRGGGALEELAFRREANGDLSLGILGTLTKNRPE